MWQLAPVYPTVATNGASTLFEKKILQIQIHFTNTCNTTPERLQGLRVGEVKGIPWLPSIEREFRIVCSATSFLVYRRQLELQYIVARTWFTREPKPMYILVPYIKKLGGEAHWRIIGHPSHHLSRVSRFTNWKKKRKKNEIHSVTRSSITTGTLRFLLIYSSSRSFVHPEF